jgi:hypothetical protein
MLLSDTAIVSKNLRNSMKCAQRPQDTNIQLQPSVATHTLCITVVNLYVVTSHYSQNTCNCTGALATIITETAKVEMGTVFWLENLKGRDHLEDLGVDGKIMLK